MPFYLHIIFEFVAAAFGTYYITKHRVEKSTRYFVYFLWLTFFVEVIGLYPGLMFYGIWLEHLKDTKWFENHWLYNIFFILNFSFYSFYLINNFYGNKYKRLLSTLVKMYIIGAVINLIFTDVYFVRISSFTYVFGTILIFVNGFIYFFEVLQSDKVLSFYKVIPFYVAFGSILFHIVVTPLFIYDKYYDLDSPNFIQLRNIILKIAIFFLYTCYTLGFIICYKKNKSYKKSKSYS